MTLQAHTGRNVAGIVQAMRPEDMTPESARELVNCWMTVANNGGAVGFPFPPVGAGDVRPVADQLIEGLDPQYSRLLLAKHGGVLAGWLHLSRHRARVVPHWGRSSGFRPIPASAATRRRRTLEDFYGRLGWREIGRWPDALRFDHGDRDEVLMLLSPL